MRNAGQSQDVDDRMQGLVIHNQSVHSTTRWRTDLASQNCEVSTAFSLQDSDMRYFLCRLHTCLQGQLGMPL